MLCLAVGLPRERNGQIRIVAGPSMSSFAMGAGHSSVALSKPMETGKVSHDTGRNFSVCFGARDDDHRDHGALSQC